MGARNYFGMILNINPGYGKKYKKYLIIICTKTA